MDTETIAVQALKEIGETLLKALARIADMRAEQSTSNVHDLLAEPLTREAPGLAEPRLRYSSPWPWLLAICISAVLWVVIAGGIIPDKDIEPLKAMGIREIFLPGTPTQALVDFIRREASDRVGDDTAGANRRV